MSHEDMHQVKVKNGNEIVDVGKEKKLDWVTRHSFGGPEMYIQ
jgi:hypothetical protein